MPESLDRLEKYMGNIPEKNKIWKIRNCVEGIEAFQSHLSKIEVVGTFIKLSDLNIGGNPLLTSLKGI